VKTAVPHISDLPAIDVYQVGDAYFVLDGNHRVSIARRQGLEFIDAYVTDVPDLGAWAACPPVLVRRSNQSNGRSCPSRQR
jgi:hypothetical protein